MVIWFIRAMGQFKHHCEPDTSKHTLTWATTLSCVAMLGYDWRVHRLGLAGLCCRITPDLGAAWI